MSESVPGVTRRAWGSREPGKLAVVRRRNHARPVALLAVPVAILVLELIARSAIEMRAPDAVIVLAIVVAAAAGGLRAGLVAALLAVIWATVRVLAEAPAGIGTVAAADAWRLAMLSLASPVLAAVVGTLRDREFRLRGVDRDLVLYRRIYQNASDGIGIIDAQGHYLGQNRAHEALTGYSAEELRGRTPAVHLGGDAFAAIARELGERGSYRGEVVSRAKDGTRRSVELSAFAVRDARGDVSCYVGVKRDISERRRAEETLRQRLTEQEALYRVVAAVGRASDLEEIYQEALSGLRAAASADRAAIVLFDADGVVRFKAWRGLSAAYRRSVEGHSPWPADARTARPLLVADVTLDDGLAAYGEEFAHEGIAALAFIPLLTHDRLLGKFMLYFDQPHEFTDAEVRVAEGIAVQVAFAIHRQRAEDAVARREQEFRALADNAPDIISRYDRELRHVYANPAITGATGMSPLEVAGRTHRELGISPEVSGQWEAAIRRVFDTDREEEIEFSIATPAGPRYYHSRLVPETSAAGVVQTVLGITRDLTERRRQEQVQRLLSEASALLVSSLEPDAVLEAIACLLAHDLGDGCAIDVVTAEGTLERAVLSMRDPARVAQVRELDRLYAPAFDVKASHVTSFRTGTPQLHVEITEEELRAASMNERHFALWRALGLRSLMSVPVAARGRTLGVVTVLSLTPGRHFTRADLDVAQELARRVGLAVDNARLFRASEAANRAKAQFLAIMSHELHTPLNAIIGYTDLLSAGVFGDVPDKQSRHLDRIRASAHHLLAVIEQILTFSRPEAESRTMHLEMCDALEVVRSALGMVEPAANEKGLELRVALPPEPILLRTDPAKLRQILLNLLGNAIKFTDHGFVELRVESMGDVAGFTVRDTGAGIESADLERIFEPFWQADQSETRTAGGTGLGLTVCRSFARLLGGDIQVVSTPGMGAIFTLELPAHSSVETPADVAPQPA